MARIFAANPLLFQSTRPQGARPRTPNPGFARRIVSIHAPAGGATSSFTYPGPLHSVSIHAPAGGATGYGRWNGSTKRSFNPRARRGRDRYRK